MLFMKVHNMPECKHFLSSLMFARPEPTQVDGLATLLEALKAWQGQTLHLIKNISKLQL